MISEAINAYSEILKALDKHEKICVYDIASLRAMADRHLFGLELKELHGLNVDPTIIKSTDWQTFGDYMAIGLWGAERGRTISWSDDKKQPKNEILLQISFPTGAYIFGEEYPKELFEKFLGELKEYAPDYCDTANKCLYFRLRNAKDIFNNFSTILKKYHDIYRDGHNQRRVEELKKEIEKLEKQKP